MSALLSYMGAMIRGRVDICTSIEIKYDLFGYSPEVVSIGLAAADRGQDVHEAVKDYLNGEAE